MFMISSGYRSRRPLPFHVLPRPVRDPECRKRLEVTAGAISGPDIYFQARLLGASASNANLDARRLSWPSVSTFILCISKARPAPEVVLVPVRDRAARA